MRGDISELIVMVVGPFLLLANLAAFIYGAAEADKPDGVCSRRSIVEYNPATLMGCALFKKRWETK